MNVLFDDKEAFSDLLLGGVGESVEVEHVAFSCRELVVGYKYCGDL